MTAQPTTGAVGWRADPFGRHELRFFDGTRWTPYVRDGEQNGMDEPTGAVPEERSTGGPRSTLLAEDVLVVEHQVEHGRRRADRAVHGADGRRVGVLRHAAASSRQSGARGLLARDRYKGDAFELVDDVGHPVLTLLRPIGAAKSTFVVRDATGHEVGRIAQQRVRGGAMTYALLGAHSAFLGDLQSPNWAGWELHIDDAGGRRVATLGRDLTGVTKPPGPTAEHYVVRMAPPIAEPLRTLVVAAALGLEVGLRTDSPG